MKFAERLKELRISKNIKQTDLAIILKTDQGTISRWEKGQLEPNFETLIKLADYFNESLDYLLGRDN